MEGIPLLTLVVVAFVLLIVLNVRKERRRARRDATWANYKEERALKDNLANRERHSGGIGS